MLTHTPPHNRFDSRLGLTFAALLFGLISGSAPPAQAQVRTVALEGDAAPGTALTFNGFDIAPVLNDNGQVAFIATVNDFATQGVWSEGDGIGLLRNVVLSGDTAPDSGGVAFVGLDSLHLNALGDVFFTADLDGFRFGIYTDRQRPTEAVSKIVIEGDPAPGTNNREFQFSPVFNGPGNIHSGAAFFSILTLGDDNFPQSGVFNESFAVILDKTALTVEFAPGTFRPSTGTLAQFDQVFAPTINDSGHVAFSAETNAGSSFGALGDAGIWTTSNTGTLRSVALTGQPAPGTATTYSILFGDAAVLNHAGDVAFTATLNGLISGGLRDGIWVERDGTVDLVAFESQTAPGTAGTFDQITSDPLIDEQGLAAFVAQLADGRDGIWKETAPGNPQPLALQGDAAPDSANTFLNILSFAVNESGQVAFEAQMSSFQDAIFATDPSGTLRKIVEVGDTLTTDAGDLIIHDLQFSGLLFQLAGGSGMNTSSGFNASGQVAFRAFGELAEEPGTFLSGIFVSDLATIAVGLTGDLDGDGFVGIADLNLVLGNWNQNVTPGDPLLGDPSGDGFVGIEDLNTVLGNWNAGTPPTDQSTNIPEPASLVGLIVVGLPLLRRSPPNPTFSPTQYPPTHR